MYMLQIENCRKEIEKKFFYVLEIVKNSLV